MDPETALREIEMALEDANPDWFRIGEIAHGLDHWIRNGGFKPVASTDRFSKIAVKLLAHINAREAKHENL